MNQLEQICIAIASLSFLFLLYAAYRLHTVKTLISLEPKVVTQYRDSPAQSLIIVELRKDRYFLNEQVKYLKETLAEKRKQLDNLDKKYQILKNGNEELYRIKKEIYESGKIKGRSKL